MGSMGDKAQGDPPDHLWAEAVWGLCLIGGVFGFVLLVSLFGH
jgi:hypothetical protein